jgi:hypothetical protein
MKSRIHLLLAVVMIVSPLAAAERSPLFGTKISSMSSGQVKSLASASIEPIALDQITSIESWTGTYSLAENCDFGGSVTSSGPMVLLLVRGTTESFVLMRLNNVAIFDGYDCVVIERLDGALGLEVTISGNTITGVPSGDPEDDFSFTATISGSSMSGGFGGEGFSGSFNVQRESSNIGALTGEYSGSLSVSATCDSGQSLSHSSPFVWSLFHSGSRLGGFASFDWVWLDTEECEIYELFPITLALAGNSSGSSIAGFIGLSSYLDFSGSASGSSISGTLSGLLFTLFEGMSTGTFTLTRGAGGALPTIDSFDASPRTIRRGESATLVWSTSNATSVSIDQGVGSRPVRGSASVAPTSTTTYKLSATGPGGTVTRETTVEVIVTAEVALTALPQQMVQGTGAGGAETSYVLTNVGGASTSITLTQQGDFFTQSPTSFTLASGQSQRVTITGLQRDTGSFRGTSIPTGNGVPQGTTVPIQLLAVPTPDGPTSAEPENSRVDLSAPTGTNPTGTATFRNTGQAKIQGTLVSTVPWIIPQPGLIEVDPGQTVTVTFTIDRAMRPPNADIGSLEGKLMLVFRTGPSGKSGGQSPHSGAASSSSVVTVVDTSKPAVQAGQIPALGPGEVALFIPGAGHVQGGAGLFFSDIALINLSGQQTLNSIDLYYTPSGTTATQKASVSGLVAGTPVALADVVKSVFEAEATLGSLQIRAPNIQQLSVNANILVRTREERPRTFGNTIPALRSDRSAGAGQSFFLTGLKKSATSHTNLFIQETSGGAVTVDIEFYDAAGVKLGERTGVGAGPFQLTGLFDSADNPVLPDGAVSAVITSRQGSTGRFAAYATPVDKLSGDSWSLVDWNAQASFAGTTEMVIPVAGALRGANNLNFRTDVSVINRGTTQASGILRYIPQPAEEGAPIDPIDRTITLGPRQSAVLEDATTTLFGLDPTQFTLGYMKFLPQTGSMTVTSRNFATVGDDPGTFGTGVATQANDASLRLGQVRRIGGVRDSAVTSIQQKVSGSFRSNFGLMETTGQAPVTVRVTVHYSFSGGTKAVARGSGSKEYTLRPNQFMQLSRVSLEILGPTRDHFGDFDNLQVDFAVVDGDGAAAVYVSSVENDTGDSILRVD